MTTHDLKQRIESHIDQEFPQIVETLKELVSINGIAFPGFDREPLQRSAEMTAEIIRDLGFDEVEILSADIPAQQATDVTATKGGPAVVARRRAEPGKPTVLLYAHHDVQPTGDLSLWNSEPFAAVERGGRLYGRGAADDKAGIMVHVAAVNALNAVLQEDPGIGVTFFIEGEEEAGSPTFRPFLEKYREKLAADVIIVADSANWRVGTPALTTSLRGLVDGLIEVRVLNHPLHSGMFGGPIIDAPTVLARVISTLHDDQGNVAIPELTQQHWAELDYPEEILRADSGAIDSLRLAGAGSIADRLWNRAALSIIGSDIPQLEVSSNTLQPTARAKFSLRLGPGMDPEEALAAFTDHVEQLDIFGAEISVVPGELGQPFLTDSKTTAAKLMLDSLEQAWGTKPVETGMGGSIPFTADLREVFPDATILITGVEDPDSRAHSANESLHLEDFKRAIVAEALFLYGITVG